MSQVIHTTDTALFKTLREFVSEEKAEIIVHAVKHEVEAQLDRAKHTLATREDVRHSETKLMWVVGLAITFGVGIAAFFQNQTNQQLAKMEQQIARMDQRIDQTNQGMNQLSSRTDRQFEQLNQRIDQVMLMIQAKK